jgi:acetyl esterase/lipase
VPAATAAASVRAASGSLLRPASRWHTYRDLRYSNAGRSASTSLDLYVPDNGAGQVPLIVWIHGGGWSAGSKDQDCVPRDKQLMARGFAVACMNYRLTSEAVWPAQIIDVKAAIRTLRAQAPRYGLYADKIGLWGASAGGHLAAMAGAAADVPQWEVGPHRDVSSRVQAVVDDFGPSDLLAEVRDSSSPAVSVAQQVVINSLFGPAGGNRAQRRAAPARCTGSTGMSRTSFSGTAPRTRRYRPVRAGALPALTRGRGSGPAGRAARRGPWRSTGLPAGADQDDRRLLRQLAAGGLLRSQALIESRSPWPATSPTPAPGTGPAF